MQHYSQYMWRRLSCIGISFPALLTLCNRQHIEEGRWCSTFINSASPNRHNVKLSQARSSLCSPRRFCTGPVSPWLFCSRLQSAKMCCDPMDALMNGANLHIAYRCFCTSSRQCLSPSHLQEPGEAVVSGTSSKSRQPHKRRRLKRAAKVEQPNDEEAAELMDDSADVFGGDERLLESAGDSLRQLSKTGRNTDSPDEVEDEESLFSEESEATDQLDDSTSATEDEETSVKASPWEVVESSKLITYLHPEIAAEYDVQANKNLAEPLEVLTTHCPSVVWWKCGTCQHSWKSAVFVRCLLKTECPKCKALKYPSVALARPALALCWDAERNDPFISLETLSIESKEKTFWRCPSCKNPYVARVKDQCRSNAIFCPHCGKTLLGDERRVRKVKVKKAKRMPKAERALVKKMKLRSLRKHPDPATEERIAAAVQKVYNIRRAQRLLTMQGGSEFKGDAQHATMPSYTE